MLYLLAFLIGISIGSLIVWALLRIRSGQRGERIAAGFSTELTTLRVQLASKEEQILDLKTRLSEAREETRRLDVNLSQQAAERARLETRIEEERKASQEKLDLMNEAKAKLTDAFKALSSDALKSNNESFLELARTNLDKFQEAAKTDLESRQKAITDIVRPVKDSLEKVDTKLQELEKERTSAYASLNQQVKSLALTQTDLKDETAKLVRALRTPNVRGRWGEMQLKRVVEMAGMLSYCDFEEQTSRTTEEGRMRPDLLVRLPGGKNIVVDAKAPLEGYLNALESNDDDVKSACLADHTRQIRDHMLRLSSKAYWDQFQPTPDFVIMFLPGETFFSAALEQNPHLIEEGVNQKVILASPTTLIALLRAIAYGWKQEQLAEGAQEISNLGKELFDRLCTFTEHLEKLGSSLESAVGHYNKSVGSFDTRVLVSARRFTELGLTSNKDVPFLKQIEKAPREVPVAELSD